MGTRLEGLATITAMAVIGGSIGLCAGFPLSTGAGVKDRHVFPLPHHFPRYPGGVSLRFAMAHDVIHERYPCMAPPTSRNVIAAREA